MIAAEWQGLAAFKRRLTTMKRRVRPEVADLLRGVSDASARAASKASTGHRRTGRLGASIKPRTTATTAGFSAVYYVRANRALSGIRKSAEAAAKVQAKRGADLLLRNLTK